MLNHLLEHPHKWSFINSLLLSSGLALVGVCLYIAFGSPLAMHGEVTSGRVAKSDDITNSLAIDYPVLRVEKVDAALRSYATQRVDAHAARLKNKQNNPQNKLALTYEIMHYGERTATVVFYEKEEIMGQPIATSQKMMTFDLTTQKQLELADIFKSDVDSQDTLANLLYDYFRQEASSTLTSAESAKLLDFKLTDVQDFVLTKDALILYINPHDLSNRKEVKTIAIKKSLLSSVMQSNFAATDREHQPYAQNQPTFSILTQPEHAKRIDPNGKLLALTFDDGPGNETPRLLEALKKHQAHATFFVLGSLVQRYADIANRTVAEGNEIGNHSWNHAHLPLTPLDQLSHQINDTQNAIKQATGGYTPVLMRPPYGEMSQPVSEYLRSHNLTAAFWNVDTNDWLDRDAQIIYERIMSSAADSKVILLHDIHPASVDAVIRAIPELTAQGYQLVTVSEMAAMRP